MKETDLKKWHRSLGIILTLFIFLQAGSGLLMSISELKTPHGHEHTYSMAGQRHNENEESLWQDSLEFIHHGAGVIGMVYQIV